MVDRPIQDGVCRFANRHDPQRWGGLMAIPAEMFAQGQMGRYRLDGLIASVTDRRVQRELMALGIPVVNVADMLIRPHFPTITVDDHAVGQAAAQYFLGRGFRHLAYLPGAGQDAFSEQRGAGYVAAAQAAGYSVSWFGRPPIRPLRGALPASGTLADWLARMPKPLAVFSVLGQRSADLYATATAARLSVPEQVAILSVENEPGLHFGLMGLSSIELPLERIGYAAAAALDRLMDGGWPEMHITRLPPGPITTRTSSDTRAVNDELVLEALRFIREHAAEAIGVDHIVSALPVSSRSLQRRFQAAIGATINQELTRVRVAHASKLLLTTGMRVAEIAEACGFVTRNRFFVAFRAATGGSPQQYRIEHGRT